MKVTLVSSTPNPIRLIADAARITHGKSQTYQSDRYYLDLLYKIGHFSVFEHVSFTFFIENISRACSHQLVRFRVGVSFTQRSQRYTNENGFEYTIPPSIQKNEIAKQLFLQKMEDLQQSYAKMIDLGIPKEDARFLLPNATDTSLFMTMNYRELIHAMELRLCKKSQWEIRHLFWYIRGLIWQSDPDLAAFLYPKCFHEGFCREKKPCSLLPILLQKKKSLFTDANL
jgi:thymidylate synthase (FAD)